MTQLAEQIKTQMSRLSHDDLEALLAHLIDLLDTDVDEGAEEAWKVEIARRVKEVESGLDVGVPADEALRMARERLEKRR